MCEFHRFAVSCTDGSVLYGPRLSHRQTPHYPAGTPAHSVGAFDICMLSLHGHILFSAPFVFAGIAFGYGEIYLDHLPVASVIFPCRLFSIGRRQAYSTTHCGSGCHLRQRGLFRHPHRACPLPPSPRGCMLCHLLYGFHEHFGVHARCFLPDRR